MKGRTNKPLNCLVDPDLLETKEILALKAKGHSVNSSETVFANYDMIIGKTSFRIAPETAHLIPLAVLAASTAKYGEKVSK